MCTRGVGCKNDCQSLAKGKAFSERKGRIESKEESRERGGGFDCL